MSNTIRYDSLLVRHLADELNARLSGRRVLTLHFDREARAFCLTVEHGTLYWPLPGGPRFEAAVQEPAGRALVLPRKARIEQVSAMCDERILQVVLAGGERENAVIELIVEVLPQPNAIALDHRGRVLKVLLSNAARRQTRGQPYLPPTPRERVGAETPISADDWFGLLAQVPAAERMQKLISRVAYLSPINADAILGETEPDLTGSYQRYVQLLTQPVQPCVIEVKGRPQPYTHPLWQDATGYESLLAAFASLPTQTAVSDTVAALEHTLQRERKKLERLAAERSKGAELAARLRSDADLLLAHAASVQRGAQQIELMDFAGEPRRLSLDPAMSAPDNAQAWYREARRRERAAERVPVLMAAAERVIGALEDRLQRARVGEPVEAPASPNRTRKDARARESLPYKRFRTSGGVEVRVGRNSRTNDELTFKHASADDVWLHAREVGGAHVVLRWPAAEGGPARRDLEQAAALAALHSRARHAGVVPVDWTLRKYVRKPRGAPAGTVRIERAKTVFVKPDPKLLDSLRWPESVDFSDRDHS